MILRIEPEDDKEMEELGGSIELTGVRQFALSALTTEPGKEGSLERCHWFGNCHSLLGRLETLKYVMLDAVEKRKMEPISGGGNIVPALRLVTPDQ
jgi:hypothetical protein